MRTIYPRQDLYSVQALVFRDVRGEATRSPALSLLILTLTSAFIGDICFNTVIASSTTFPLYFHFILIIFTLIFCSSQLLPMLTLQGRNTTRQGRRK